MIKGPLPSRLDLHCPVAWPRLEASNPVALGLAEVASLQQVDRLGPHIVHTTFSQCLPATLPDAESKLYSEQCPNDCFRADWLQRRYTEALWLGEHHSPLIGFLRHLDRFAKELDDVKQVAQILQGLLRTRQQIRDRIQCAAKIKEEFSNATRSGCEAISIPQCPDDNWSVLRAALSSGPAILILKAQACASVAENVTRLHDIWLDAIETRELQLQILVILALLRLNVENPTLTSDMNHSRQHQGPIIATSSVTDSIPHDGADDGGVIKKRRRKAEKAHRLTGQDSFFPWQIRARGRIVSKAAPAELSVGDGLDGAAVDSESLAKRFESFIDMLCLRIVTTTVDLDVKIDSSPKSSAPQTPGRSTALASRQQTKIRGCTKVMPRFGSESRKLAEGPEGCDVLQWFCSQVIEPHYSRALPRQCGMLRSRCFIPAMSMSNTPARLTRRNSKDKTLRNSGEILSMNDKQRQVSDNDPSGSPRAFARASTSPMQSKERPLKRSLLDEDQSKLYLKQTSAAARRRTALDNREVNVRRRWERSQSLNNMPSFDMETALSSSRNLISRTDAATCGSPKRSERQSKSAAHTLVFETPVKVRR